MISEEYVKELKDCIRSSKYTYKTSDLYGEMLEFNKGLTRKNYINICGLWIFAIKHKELSNRDIWKLIKENKETFKFLDELSGLIPDVVDELRLHGVMRVAERYRSICAICRERVRVERLNMERKIKNL